MIFRQVNEILHGEKTQTRRIAKDNEIGVVANGGVFTRSTNGTRLKWRIGRDYAVMPKRGKPCYFHEGKPLRIVITDIRCEPLHNITEAEARAEGVASIAEYRNLWEQINGAGSWGKNPLVWVITFERVVYS